MANETGDELIRRVEASNDPAAEVPARLLRALEATQAMTQAMFAAIRARTAGPVIGHLAGAKIYEYISGADGARWEFDGRLYPGRKLSDSHIVAKNSAVYVRMA